MILSMYRLSDSYKLVYVMDLILNIILLVAIKLFEVIFLCYLGEGCLKMAKRAPFQGGKNLK